MTGYIITGASGALGSALLPQLLASRPGAAVVALFRSESSASSVLEGLSGSQRRRVRACIADLESDASMDAASAALRGQDITVGIHLAADVSWEKTASELVPINVDGAMRFARFLESVAGRPRLVFVSTAFTAVHDWEYRNGYEETKAQAERQLRETFGRRHPMNVFSCSLVLGDSKDGHIARYHGIYPLIRFLDRFAPPFLVGKKEGRFDLIPVDWAVEQLLHAIGELEASDDPRDVVASAGGNRITYERLVELLIAGLDEERRACHQPPLSATPILRMRQWEFLKRSLSAWKPPGLRERDFRYFERLLRIYGQYAECDTVRAPCNTSSPAPSPEDYLPAVIRHWWRQEGGAYRHSVPEVAR